MAIIGIGKHRFDCHFSSGDVESLRYLESIRSASTVGMRDCLAKNCRKAVVDGVVVLDGVYVWDDSVVFEINSVCWEELRGKQSSTWYLRKLYVLDSERGNGLGSQFIAELKSWCDTSRSLVGVCAVGFGVGVNGSSSGCAYFKSVNELLRFWQHDYLVASIQDDLLVNWYSRLGFRRCQVLGPEFPETVRRSLCIRKQLVYAGKGLSPALLQAIDGRSRSECVCDSCRCPESTHCL